MTLYEGEVLDWNWIRSYGIAKITNIVGENAGENNPMIGKEIFLTQSFKSDETGEKLKQMTDEQKKEFDVEFLLNNRLWFENGEHVRFKITDKGLAYDIIKLELD
jgi:hypothetical protein